MTKTNRTTWNRNVFGIVNGQGKPWTYDVFVSETHGRAYLQGASKQNPTWDLGRHKVVPVSVTMRVIAAKKP